MDNTSQSSWTRYLAGAVATLAALIIALILRRVVEPDPDPFILFVAAVAVSAWYGGLGPSLLAMSMSVAMLIFFFIPPVFSFAMVAGDLIRLIPFLAVSALIGLLSAERRRAEHRMKQSLESEHIARTDAEKANEAKDVFLATASHELRTPLNAIAGWVDLLKRSQGDAEVASKGINTIGRNVASLSRLVEDIIDISRSSMGRLRLEVHPLDLRPVVESAIETLQPAAEAKSIRVEASFDESVDLILGDPDRLQQIVWNLISNAVKFTETGGRISVELRRNGRNARLVVRDTGKGIRPEFLPYVFDRFRQDTTGLAGSKGLGLGLAIVRHLVELHGGIVTVQSDGQGCGAAFTVELPLTGASAVEVTALESGEGHDRVSIDG
jgi:signal transduction histidine kinase